MTLTVAVQSGLAQVAGKLAQQGYRVVSMEENMEPADVIVYSGVSDDLTVFDAVDYYGDGATMGVNSPSGVMLVNAHNRTPDDVVSLVNGRFGWMEE
jgi:uncharacterized protein (DUF362 family)